MRRTDIFDAPEESSFYSQCVERFIFNSCNPDARLIEFGSGDGMPIINAITRTHFKGKIVGHEINKAAYQHALINIQQAGVQEVYEIYDTCFFESSEPSLYTHLLVNPPYIPSYNPHILLPFIWGGPDGSDVTRRLLMCTVVSLKLF